MEVNSNKATKSQLSFIRSIQEFVNEEFTGTTKQEASDYIDKHIEDYKLQSMDNWCVSNGYF